MQLTEKQQQLGPDDEPVRAHDIDVSLAGGLTLTLTLYPVDRDRIQIPEVFG